MHDNRRENIRKDPKCLATSMFYLEHKACNLHVVRLWCGHDEIHCNSWLYKDSAIARILVVCGVGYAVGNHHSVFNAHDHDIGILADVQQRVLEPKHGSQISCVA